MNWTDYFTYGAMIAMVVMAVVGGIKAQYATVKGWYTVLLAALLCYGIAIAHAFATNPVSASTPLALPIEQALILGSVAWAGSLGVSLATRLSLPKA
jgi:hypothetical protein